MAAFLFLAACSDTPTTETKAPERVSEPLTGRQAFQMTFPSARTWASDCEPIRIRSFNVENPKSKDGKAGVWEITYVSQSRGRGRVFTWSAIDSGESLHKGVFGNLEQAWSGPQGQDRPFATVAIKTDTPEALKTAIARSAEYLDKPGKKPEVNFMLESSTRFPNPSWRVFWGQTVSSAEWSIFVDASTGQYAGR